MSAVMYNLIRHRDVTGISGEGQVATIVEFEDGHTVLHWDTATPSTTVYTDIRHIAALHGHGGASTLELYDNARLLAGYQAITPWLLQARDGDRPLTVGPHPDHPDRLRATFADKETWAFFVALLDGSTDAASHVEVNGEIEHTWISADGNVWLQYYSPTTPGLTWDSHDDPEVQP